MNIILMSKASKIWCFCFASYISKARMTLKCGSILVNECFSIESFRLGKCYEHYWVRLPLWYFVASCPKPGWQKPNELGATLVWVQRLKKKQNIFNLGIFDPVLLAVFEFWFHKQKNSWNCTLLGISKLFQRAASIFRANY